MNAADDKEEERKSRDQDQADKDVERSVKIINNRLQSRDLFVDSHDIVILHGRDAYHLRLTSQNKLILTK